MDKSQNKKEKKQKKKPIRYIINIYIKKNTHTRTRKNDLQTTKKIFY